MKPNISGIIWIADDQRVERSSGNDVLLIAKPDAKLTKCNASSNDWNESE